ncbi:ATP-binding cassette domain-containing protein [Lactiplantibacillus nangangensis]|uniref:ATP-binding cassette domain-containing protein n=1 Tax=Lactiplantibacillus nangangensis TaxID=2559917 RepID=A0ABW1SLM1_9LACO|nr:ABC transporter ATP-binding protein [Lactiplantibacillus nangangensis]
MTKVLTIKDLTYKQNRKTILSSVALELDSGKIVGLLGENGAGKTTLMRLITGSAKGKGQITVSGEAETAKRKAHVSFSEQLHGFSTGYKVEQVVKFYQTVYPDFDLSRYQAMAEFLQIDGTKKLAALSKGMKEKVVIALTLARQTDLYLLDEPFSGIDSMSRKRIISSILQWKPDAATILISDHYVTEIAPILDEIVIVKDQGIAVHTGADTIRDEKGLEIEDYYESFYAGGDNHDEI